MHLLWLCCTTFYFLKCCTWPRLYIHMLLQCKMDAFVTIWGIVCSSWTQVNQFTSKRSQLLPEGDPSRDYVVDANCMCSRLLDHIYIYKFVFCQINHQHICVGPPIQSCMILWIIYIMRVILKKYICLYIYKCWSILGRPDLPTQFTYIKIYIYCTHPGLFMLWIYIGGHWPIQGASCWSP